jgi:hypothetical protein
MRRIRQHLTFANVVSVIALFIASESNRRDTARSMSQEKVGRSVGHAATESR